MADEIKMKITVDTKSAEKNVEDLNKDLQQTGQMAVKAGEAAEKSKSGWNKMTGAVKGVGLAFKAAGIGIIIGLLAKLFEMLKGNQAVMDFFNKASYTLSILFNQLAEAVKPLGKLISDAFNNPKQAIIDLWEAIKTNLLNRVTGIVDTFKFLGKTISAAISLDWTAVKENAAELGESLLQVTTGIEDLPSKIADGIGSIANTFSEATKAADDYIERQNQLKLNEAELNKFIAANKEEINSLKIIRDDENQSMEDRIAATEKINELIGEETARSIALQEEKIALMKADLENTQTTVDDLVAVGNAEAQLANLRADASTRERENLLKINSIRKQVAATELAALKEIEAERAKIADERSKEIEVEIQADIDRYEAFLTRKSELTNQWALDDASSAQEFYDIQRDIEVERYEAEIENIMLTNEERELLEEEHKRKMADINAESIKTEAEQEKARLEHQQSMQKARLDIAMSAVNLVKSIADENSALAKAAMIAEKAIAITTIVLNTMAANAKATAASPITFGQPWVTVNTIQGALGVATVVAETAKGLGAFEKGGILPKHATGGVLIGPSHAQGGILTQFGELEGGEGIINKVSMQNPSLRNLASIANEAGGGTSFGTGEATVKLSEESLEILAQKINDKQVFVTEYDITDTQKRVAVIEEDSYL